MEFLGKTYNNKEIFYCHVRTEKNWYEHLPQNTHSWILFTIANKEDKDLLKESIKHFTNNISNPLFISCSGELNFDGEFLFDRAFISKIENGYEYPSHSTTMGYSNFSEGVEFVIKHIFDAQLVICLDFTVKGVKRNLTELTHVINDDWESSDNEFEEPEYD